MARQAPTSTNRGASTHALGIVDQIRSVLSHHFKTCTKTLLELLGSWVSSLMTWVLIGIALALPVFLYLLLTNSMSLGEDFDGTAKVNVYLAKGAESEVLLAQIRDMSEVASAHLIQADDALQAFQEDSGFADIIASLPGNPLPDLIELEPKDSAPGALKLLSASLSAREDIDKVAVDLEWLNRLQALLLFGERFVFTLAAFLSLGVVLAIGNSIRLAIENRRSEIEIIKLVGATDAFVRRPFLYLGFWYGFGGALLGWLFVQMSFLLLSGPIERLLVSYQNQFDLQGLGLDLTLAMFLVGGGLGTIGAAVSVSRHLHTIEPR